MSLIQNEEQTTKDHRKNISDEITVIEQKVLDIFSICKNNQHSLTRDQLEEYTKQISVLEYELIRLLACRTLWHRLHPFKELFIEFREILRKKSPSWYIIPVILNSTEVVNGFNLLEIHKELDEPLFSYFDFLNFFWGFDA